MQLAHKLKTHAGKIFAGTVITFLLFLAFFSKFLNKLKLNKNLNFLINLNKIIEQIIIIE